MIDLLIEGIFLSGINLISLIGMKLYEEN